LQLKHRTVKDFIKHIPKDLQDKVLVQEFLELNSLVLSGSPNNIEEFEEFIAQVDKPVPVISIELLIVNLNDSKSAKVGLEIASSTTPVTSGGSIFPGVDFTFGAKGINELLRLLKGNGIINLGQIKPNFYATLQAVEDNGYAKVNSKPRLSTLNGKEATFSIGETRYFKIERTTLQGNQTPVTLQDRTYQSVNADFTIKVTPVVSGDEFVTLDIEVKQSDFTGQVASDAPPSQVSRNFSSSIRIKNKEMIVLGGLESKSTTDNGKGVPILSHIPIIKWFFSKRTKSTQKTELLIFVKPTVYY
jgi:type IV pilus assembly protein PilQ